MYSIPFHLLDPGLDLGGDGLAQGLGEELVLARLVTHLTEEQPGGGVV